ncbi:thiamine pyrophosphate-binding protein, partial [Acidianus sp. RZ1]|uniref:thiamine pyrophosphate-binding protein n=1 Tax=Acidianus sp. RZ1 TaxID=1540082 RepID=UPI0020A3B011
MSQPKRKEETVGKEMSGDEAIAFTLNDIGIKKIFTTYNLPDNLRERLLQYNINIDTSVTPRDSFLLAQAYAMSNNSAGVVIQIPSTQILEAVDIVAQSFIESVPLLIIGGLRSYRDTGRARIGELRTPDDVMSLLAPVTKLRERVVTIEEIVFTIEKGNKEALSNRTRPVYIEIAEDLFKMKAYPLNPAEQKPEKRTPDKNTVAKVAEVLSNSKLPLIVAGYGVIASGSSKDLIELAELIDAPVITTIKGKGGLPSSHPLFAGEGLGLMGTDIGNKIMAESDAILFIGTRLTQLSTGGWSMKFKGFTMFNNIDGEDVSKVIMPHLPIVSDSGLFIKELIALLKQKIQNIDRGIRKEIYVSKKDQMLRPHSTLWPYDVVRLLKNYRFSKIFIDLSAPTFDMIRFPVDMPIWFTSESIMAKGLGVSGVIQEDDSSAIGITDIHGVFSTMQLLQARRKSKGTIIIFNDEGLTYLDTTKADTPVIGKANLTLNVDKQLEKSIGAIT